MEKNWIADDDRLVIIPQFFTDVNENGKDIAIMSADIEDSRFNIAERIVIEYPFISDYVMEDDAFRSQDPNWIYPVAAEEFKKECRNVLKEDFPILFDIDKLLSPAPFDYESHVIWELASKLPLYFPPERMAGFAENQLIDEILNSGKLLDLFEEETDTDIRQIELRIRSEFSRIFSLLEHSELEGCGNKYDMDKRIRQSVAYDDDILKEAIHACLDGEESYWELIQQQNNLEED